MKLEIDLYFTYKYTLRFLLLQKLNSNNTYNLPKIQKLKFYFLLRKIEDLDSPEIYNYLYLFRYFFGKNAYLAKNKSYFVLGKWYYNFNVNMILNNIKDISYVLFFFFNDIIKNIDPSFIKKGFFSKKLNVFFFAIKDMNVFSEMKTNVGLFNLKKALNLHIYCLGINTENTMIFLNTLKINQRKLPKN
jgi:hypothetical protein